MDGALGPVVFQGGLGSMNTFHAVTKTKKESFAKHRIVQLVDIIEDTGAEPIDLTVQMHFHNPFTMAPGAALSRLEALMDAKVPVPLIIGSTPVGRGFLTLFVIEAIDTKMTKFSASSLIIADIDVKLIEYAGALSLAGPLAAVGGAIPGLSGAVASITGALSGATAALNIASTAAGVLGFGPVKQLGSGAAGGIVSSLAGATSANSLTALLGNLTPGQVTSVVAPSAAMVSKAVANLRAAGH